MPRFSQQNSSQSSIASVCVLVIENHDDTRSLLKSLLELRGYQVMEAADGEQALGLFGDDKQDLILPNLILLKTVLPGLDGLTVMCELRTFKAFADVPVIFLSSRAELALISKAFELGGNDFLVKPIEINSLEQTLNKYLAGNLDEHEEILNGDGQSITARV